MNRLQLRTAVIEYAEAERSQRWDTVPGGSVDRRISSVFDRLWRRILDANRFYRCSPRTPTAASDGRYLLSDLNGGGAATDSFQRFNRVLTVIIDGQHYTGPVDIPDLSIALLDTSAASGSSVAGLWGQQGDRLVVVPVQPGKVADAIWVNWIPQRPVDFEDENSEVVWPEGYDEVLICHGAARLLMKGGVETQASLELKNEVAEDFQEMLQYVARISTNPLQMRQVDDAGDWGGH